MIHMDYTCLEMVDLRDLPIKNEILFKFNWWFGAVEGYLIWYKKPNYKSNTL